MKEHAASIVVKISILLGVVIFALSPTSARFGGSFSLVELREGLVWLTGTCGVTLMVASLLFSSRLSWLHKRTKNINKGYEVHKWAGIFAMIFVMCHFLLEQVPKWLVGLDIIQKSEELESGFQFSELEIAIYQSGMFLIQPIFYIMAAFVVIAVYSKIPHIWFVKTHKFFPILFLIAAYHAATAQLKEKWLGSAGSFLLMLVLLAGVVLAIISLYKSFKKDTK